MDGFLVGEYFAVVALGDIGQYDFGSRDETALPVFYNSAQRTGRLLSERGCGKQHACKGHASPMARRRFSFH